MPELPEVETIVRDLRRSVAGKKLVRFFVFDKERLERPHLKLPRRVFGVERRGKYIVFFMDGNSRCAMHLRMTGKLLLQDGQTDLRPAKHERARFHFHDGSTLSFMDIRRFGTIDWGDERGGIAVLGPDPLSKKFTPKVFRKALYGSRRAIKSVLLDQKIVAGIGNIYADEALWTAKIDPRREAGSLSAPEDARLAAAIKKVLCEGIKRGGFTLRDYRHIDGSRGGYQRFRKIYGREGEKCFRCGGRIKKIKIGGRSSYFCSNCQR